MSKIEIPLPFGTNRSRNISVSMHESSSKKYRCHYKDCLKQFKRHSRLLEHLNTHLEVRPYRCNFCEKSYSRADHLKRHLISHSANKRPFLCEICNTGFSSKSHLKRHKDRVDCSKKFSRQGIKDEVISKGSERPANNIKSRPSRLLTKFACSYPGCSLFFPSISALDKHIEATHGFVCNLCEKIFKNKKSLRQHFRTCHTKKAVFLCTLCLRKFSSKSNLSQHMKTAHSGTSDTNICDKCKSVFSTKGSLTRHLKNGVCDPDSKKPRDDSEIRQFDIVDAVTGNIPSRNQQIRENGISDEKYLFCPIPLCKSKFKRQYDMDRHIMTYHSQ